MLCSPYHWHPDIVSLEEGRMRAGCNELSAPWWLWREEDDLSGFHPTLWQEKYGEDNFFQFMFAVWLGLCFTVTAHLLPPHRAWHWPPEPPFLLCSKGLSDCDRKGCLTPTGIPPELRLEQRRQQPPPPAQRLNKQYPVQGITKWSPSTLRSVHSWGPYASSGKSLIF